MRGRDRGRDSEKERQKKDKQTNNEETNGEVCERMEEIRTIKIVRLYGIKTWRPFPPTAHLPIVLRTHFSLIPILPFLSFSSERSCMIDARKLEVDVQHQNEVNFPNSFFFELKNFFSSFFLVSAFGGISAAEFSL